MISIYQLRSDLRDHEQLHGGSRWLKTRRFLNTVAKNHAPPGYFEGGGNFITNMFRNKKNSSVDDQTVIGSPSTKNRQHIERAHDTLANSLIDKTSLYRSDPELQFLEENSDDHEVNILVEPDSESEPEPAIQRVLKELMKLPENKGKARRDVIIDTRRKLQEEIAQKRIEIQELHKDIAAMEQLFHVLDPPPKPPNR